jgi:chorismate mutase
VSDGPGWWCVALRGATTVDVDASDEIVAATRELLEELCRVNCLSAESIVSAIFSATPDLHSVYPAAVARAIGWTDVAMLCVTEMDVPGSVPRCIRVLLHVSVPGGRRLRAVYLREARTLRPDLVEPALTAHSSR